MNTHKSVMFGIAIGLPLVALFQCWPFLLIFILLGFIAAIIISAIVGQAVNILLILIVEYLLMAGVLFIAQYVSNRQKK